MNTNQILLYQRAREGAKPGIKIKYLLKISISISWKGLHTLPVVPVMIYTNADTDKVKFLADNLNKSGVYRWTNKTNGKTYIGSSVNLTRRFYTYFSIGSLAKSNRHIDRALLKYGFSNFSMEILEYCDEKELLLKREQYYLDNLKPQYNIVETAGSTLGYKHTEESIEKMRNFVLSEEVIARKRLATANATASSSRPTWGRAGKGI
jgi:hypothetical protein